MTAGLSETDLKEFAVQFHRPELVRQVLDLAGLSRADQPVWQAGSALEYWREVNTLVLAGALVDGRQRLLAAARRIGGSDPSPAPPSEPGGAGTGFTQVTLNGNNGVMITNGGGVQNNTFGVATGPAD